MTPEQIALDELVDSFASEWLRLDDAQLAARVVPTRSLCSAPTAPLPFRGRLVVATISWTFSHGGATAALVSDSLLECERTDGLRCVAYLPRTSVLDHLD